MEGLSPWVDAASPLHPVVYTDGAQYTNEQVVSEVMSPLKSQVSGVLSLCGLFLYAYI